MTALVTCLALVSPAAAGGTRPGSPDGSAGGPGVGAAFVNAPQRYIDPIFDDVRTKDIPFATVTNYLGKEQTLLLDVVQPVGDTAEKRPAILWMSGGSFRTVSRSSVYNWTDRSAHRGYVAFTIEYRVRPDLDHADLPALSQAMADAMHDAQAAIRWIRANADTYNIDPERIFVGGYSAGAITSLWVNFGAEGAEEDGPNPGFPSNVNGAVSLAGAFGSKPVAGDPPIVMFHGTQDTTVPFFMAVAKCQQTLDVGNICEWHEYDTAHGLPWTTIYPLAFDFIYRHMTCGERFTDIAPLPDEFCPAIDWAANNQVANGYPDGTYRPTSPIQRQHMIAMIWRMAGSPAPSGAAPFPDVSASSPFHDAIAWASENGIANGYSDGRFKPTATITRQAATAYIWAWLGKPAPIGVPTFADVSPDHPFAGSIAWAAEAGVVLGFEDNTFRPIDPVTRQAAAAQLQRTAPLLP